jgi:hypothetical protein
MTLTRSFRTRVGLPMTTALAMALVAVVVALPHAAATGVPAERPLETPVLGDLLYASGPLAEASTRTPRIADTARAYRARSRTAAGEQVDLRISPFYSFDPARIQRWVDYLGSLLHGAELESVVVYLAPPFEISRLCGRGAAACYSPADKLIVAPGEDLDAQTSAESVLAHEYGHHVANSSLNPPWKAVDYGTKRWASYANICRGAADGQVFPGDQGERYHLNPGEGFAEAYRVTNQRRLGVAEAPWQIVDQRFYPDSTAMALIEKDVTQPWSATSSVSYAGRFRPGGPRTRTFAVSTPLDGVVTANVRASKGSSFRVTKAQTTVCGQRTTNVTVRRFRGFGGFRLSVSRP